MTSAPQAGGRVVFCSTSIPEEKVVWMWAYITFNSLLRGTKLRGTPKYADEDVPRAKEKLD